MEQRTQLVVAVLQNIAISKITFDQVNKTPENEVFPRDFVIQNLLALQNAQELNFKLLSEMTQEQRNKMDAECTHDEVEPEVFDA